MSPEIPSKWACFYEAPSLKGLVASYTPTLETDLLAPEPHGAHAQATPKP